MIAPEILETARLVPSTTDRVIHTLESGRVSRYHSAPTVKAQSDGQHAWGVCVILLYLTKGDISVELLAAGVMHDAPEIDNGDIPFSTKKNPIVKAMFDAMDAKAMTDHHILDNVLLNSRETALLKIADTLEAFIWCCKTEERSLLIYHRWQGAFDIALQKFIPVISDEECELARKLFNQFLIHE